MSHDHHQHNHDHSGKNLLWATLLNVIITVFQIIGGILSNSLALISDAIHNLGDALAVLIAYIANRISQKDPTYSKTFGYKRVEILAALLNALVLVIICVVLVYESIERIQEGRGEELNDFEQLDQLRDVADRFASFRDPCIRRIDATEEPDRVQANIRTIVSALLEGKK